jgi:hypothetical protein
MEAATNVSNRLKLVVLTTRAIEAWLTTQPPGVSMQVRAGLPEGAILRRWFPMSAVTGHAAPWESFGLVFEHESFDPVPDYEEIPVLLIEVFLLREGKDGE